MKQVRSRLVSCEKCGKQTKIANSQFSIAGRGRFCSKVCRYPKQITVTCPECGKSKNRPPSIALNAKYCSFKCKASAYKVLKKGDNNSAWRGGITRLGHSIRTTDRHLLMRKRVIIRDGGYCVECRSYKKLEVHHIKPLWKILEEFLATGQEFNAEHDYFYDESNLVTLCRKCHVTKKV